MSEQQLTSFQIWYMSLVSALSEIIFLGAPIGVWLVAVLAADRNATDVNALLVWPFFALSLWVSALRDSVKAYCREGHPRDKFQRDISLAVTIPAVVTTSIVLAAAVFKSLGAIESLWLVHDQLVTWAILIGAVFALATKAVAIQRAEYKYFV